VWRVIFNWSSLREPSSRTHSHEAVHFRDAAEFEAWLDAHVDLPAGVWLRMAKKRSGVASLTSDEAVDAGLCYGWISGQRKSLDHIYYLQKYVPRRPRSHWSQLKRRQGSRTDGRGADAAIWHRRGRGGEGRWQVARAKLARSVVYAAHSSSATDMSSAIAGRVRRTNVATASVMTMTPAPTSHARW
jgi:hypothetical protein